MKNSYSILCVCTCVHTCRLPRVEVRRQHSGVRSSSCLARQCPACCFCCACVLQASWTSSGPGPLWTSSPVSTSYLVMRMLGWQKHDTNIQLFMWVPGNKIQFLGWLGIQLAAEPCSGHIKYSYADFVLT